MEHETENASVLGLWVVALVHEMVFASESSWWVPWMVID
jgi:hypothetical protein